MQIKYANLGMENTMTTLDTLRKILLCSGMDVVGMTDTIYIMGKGFIASIRMNKLPLKPPVMKIKALEKGSNFLLFTMEYGPFTAGNTVIYNKNYKFFTEILSRALNEAFGVH